MLSSAACLGPFGSDDNTRAASTKKGAVRMLRSNLFRTFAVFAAFLGANVFAQQGHWQMPGFRLPQSGYQAPTVDYYMGQKPKLWDSEMPIERALTAVAQRSWMRLEYIHWTIQGPGNHPIGAPVTGAVDPQNVFDNLNGGISAGIAVTPNAGSLGLDDASGIRGTWGVDLHNADFELEFFGTEEKSDSFSITDISAFRPTGLEATGTALRPNLVTPLLTNGGVTAADAANYLVYDDTFSAGLSSQVWGAEATLLTKPYIEGQGTEWQWLGGFRYLAVDETFNHRGTYTNGGTVSPAAVSAIGAETSNNIYGPEIGARVSLKSKWFNFSATPRIAFALNDYTADTYAGPLRGEAAGFTSRVSETDVEFTPIIQLGFKGEVHVSPSFSLYGGYDFMWVYRMTRPFDNIVYDSALGGGGAFDPDIRQNVDMGSFYTRGFSIGGVFRY